MINALAAKFKSGFADSWNKVLTWFILRLNDTVAWFAANA
jgi:hypothetical protein